MIVMISDLDLRGSGYMNITIALANQLAGRFDKEVTVLGFGYDGRVHDWPFQIIPVKPDRVWQYAPAMLNNLILLGEAGVRDAVEAVVVLLDIPHQEQALGLRPVTEGRVPLVGLFPVESGPLCETWANSIARMSGAMVISKYGKRMMDEVCVDGDYIPIGIDPDAWRLPVPGEREAIRETLGLGKIGEEFVVLTVCDNQERKNLSASALAISELVHKHKVNARWILVTRVGSPVGWKLSDLANQHKIADRLTTFERGIDHTQHWSLHAAADAFLLTSKAEGLGMPIIEAMAVGTPVVATDCTAIHDHLYDDAGKPSRGFPISVEYVHQDPWGNSYRHYADPSSAARQLKKVFDLVRKGRIEKITDSARKYAESRDWDAAGDVFHDVIMRAIEQSTASKEAANPQVGRTPITVPQPVAPIGVQEERENE